MISILEGGRRCERHVMLDVLVRINIAAFTVTSRIETIDVNPRG